MKSCIYTGHIRHCRHAPVKNRFRYAMFMMYLDLAELDRLFRGRLFWSTDRPNIARFRRSDYLGDPDMPLDTAVRNLIKERLNFFPEGPIRMVTHLRYFGYIFNPVTFYYAFDRSETEVEAIVADITNTPWNERYAYVLDAGADVDGAGEMHFRFAKSFHVSPFMEADLEYDWRFSRPGEELHVQMVNLFQNSRVFEAILDMKRQELNGRNLASMLLSFPPITLKVIGGIYWQALRLKIKGARFYTHPKKRRKTEF